MEKTAKKFATFAEVESPIETSIRSLPRRSRYPDRPTKDKAEKLVSLLNEVGFANLGVTALDFTASGQVIQLGHAPSGIYILTSISVLGPKKH